MSNNNLTNDGNSISLAQRIHIILLGVNDVQTSTAFYDALGWIRAKDSHVEFVKYDLGGFAIALISKVALANDVGYQSNESFQYSDMALIYLVKSKDDVKKVLQKAVDAGGTLVKPATVTPYGIAGYFRDPDGHLFEVDYEEKFLFTDDHHLVTD